MTFGYCEDVAVDIEKLSSSEKQEREAAFARLSKKSQSGDKKVVLELRSGMLNHKEPEVRLRCQSLLWEHFLKKNLPNRGFLGVRHVAKVLQFEGKRILAVNINSVVPDSAASIGGLKIGDDIVSFDGRGFGGAGEAEFWKDFRGLAEKFRGLIEDAGMGAEVELGVMRQGELLHLKVKLGLSQRSPENLSEIEERFPNWLRSLDAK